MHTKLKSWDIKIGNRSVSAWDASGDLLVQNLAICIIWIPVTEQKYAAVLIMNVR